MFYRAHCASEGQRRVSIPKLNLDSAGTQRNGSSQHRSERAGPDSRYVIVMTTLPVLRPVSTYRCASIIWFSG